MGGAVQCAEEGGGESLMNLAIRPSSVGSFCGASTRAHASSTLRVTKDNRSGEGKVCKC